MAVGRNKAYGRTKMKEQETLTDFLRTAISESKKTAKELHSETGLSEKAIEKLISGETKSLHPKTILALTKALNIPIGALEGYL